MQVEAMILGEQVAPWEDESKALALAKRFGHLKEAIMALLNRTPEARPTMASLQHACKRVLSHTTTTVPETAAGEATHKPPVAAVPPGELPATESMHIESMAGTISEPASGTAYTEEPGATTVEADLSPMPPRGPRHKFFGGPAPPLCVPDI